MQQTHRPERTSGISSQGDYLAGRFNYLSQAGLYGQVARTAKETGVCIRHYSATKISFENTVFGRRISGIETIVQREFIPLTVQQQ